MRIVHGWSEGICKTIHCGCGSSYDVADECSSSSARRIRCCAWNPVPGVRPPTGAVPPLPFLAEALPAAVRLKLWKELTGSNFALGAILIGWGTLNLALLHGDSTPPIL